MEFNINVPDPEDIQRHFQEMADRHNMAQTAAAHDVQRLFMELDKESLKTLRFLFHVCSGNPMAASYYEAVCSTTLVLKHGCCSCGERHETIDDLTAQVESPGLAPPAGGDTSTAGDTSPNPSTPDEAVNPVQPNMTLDELLQQMEKFNVGPMPDDATGRVQCLGCDYIYPSLEDRMLRKDCPSCIERAKWG